MPLIQDLDEAHWIATSAPLETFNCDPVLLKYLDADGNGRIRTDEIRNAQKWLFDVLKDTSKLAGKSDCVSLDEINNENPDGEKILTAAKFVLENLGEKDAAEINLAQIRNRQEILGAGVCNGDGIVPPEVLPDDPKTAQLITDIIDTMGSKPDASGKPGVDAELLEKFTTAAKDHLEWIRQGKIETDKESSPVMIWGDATAGAYNMLAAVKDKFDEFFNLCALVQMDADTAEWIELNEAEVREKNLTDVTELENCVKSQPLAKPNPDGLIDLTVRVNPVWKDQLDAFSATVLKNPALNLNPARFTREDWKSVKKLFAGYATWVSAKKGPEVEKLEEKKLRHYLNGRTREVEKLKDIIEKDKEVATELQQLENVEKLILYHKFLFEVVNNFVNLKRLFDPTAESLIQAGALVMDERRFDLAMKVNDLAAHKKIAVNSNICTMYLELSAKTGDKSDTMKVAVGVTSGFADNLYIGKAGVFFTPGGREWDAKIIDYISQPVSLSEALRSPFRKVGQFISKQVERFKTDRYKELETGMNKGITNAEKKLTAAKPAPVAAGSFWGSGSMLMLGGGLGLAAIGSAFAFVVKTLKNVSMFHILAVILGIMLIIAVPIVIAALIKLRRRNVGMFLEACGWAINARMRLTYKMGLLFTHFPAYPPDSKKQRGDLTRKMVKQMSWRKQRSKQWLAWLLVILVICLALGYLAFAGLGLGDKLVKIFTGIPEKIVSVTKSKTDTKTDTKPAKPAASEPAGKTQPKK